MCRFTAASKLASFFEKGQPREPLHKRADRKVVPLDVRGAYRALFAAAYPAAPGSLRANHFRRRVVHHGILVFLYDRAELHVGAKGQVNGLGTRLVIPNSTF